MKHTNFRLEVGVGYRLIHNGESFEFRERRKNKLDWVGERSRELLTMTDIELYRMLSAGSCTLQLPGLDYDPDTDLEIIGDAARRDGSHANRKFGERKRVDSANRLKGADRLHYVQRVRDAGLHLSPTSKAAAVLLEQIRQERDDAVAPSCSTLRRWLLRGDKHATAPRLSSRQHLKGNRKPRLHPEVQGIIENEIAEKFLCPAPLPKSQLLGHIQHRVNETNKSREAYDQLDQPGEKALRNAIKRISRFDILDTQLGRTKAFTKEGFTMELPDPEAPLDRVEIDHSVFDLIVVDEENGLPLGRPTIAVGIDRCTRMPYAVHVSFEPPSLLTVMELLKNGLLFKDYVELMREDPISPWSIENDWPVGGIPRCLVVDLARENMSDDLRDLAFKLHINEIHFMPGRRAWYKGGVERFIGTANRQIAHSAPGTTFSNILQRGDYDSVKRAVVTLKELLHAIHKWLIDIYQMTPHRGLNKETPRSKWNRLIEIHPVTTLTDRRELDQIGRRERSSIKRSGISLHNIKYNSKEFDIYRKSPECAKIRGDDNRVEFLYDPKDLSEVRIVKHDRAIMRIPAVPKWAAYVQGLSIWQHLTIQGFANKNWRKGERAKQLLKAKVDLYELMRRRLAKPQKGKKSNSIAGAKRASRFRGEGRSSYSGSNTVVDAMDWKAPPQSAYEAGVLSDVFPFQHVQPDLDDSLDPYLASHEESEVISDISKTFGRRIEFSDECDFDPYNEDEAGREDRSE